MKERSPQTVDEYIGGQPEALRSKLEQVRAAIRRAVPEASEGIGYGMPGYRLMGKPLLYFAGFKNHYSLFAASGTFFASLEEELKDYERRKGTIHFPLDKPVPLQLISRIASLRAAGICADGHEKECRPREENRQAASIRTACSLRLSNVQINGRRLSTVPGGARRSKRVPTVCS